MPAGQARLEDPALRKYRAQQMIDMRITSHTLKEVAERFDVSIDTVQTEIAWYVKNGFLADVESEMLSLTGEALRVYKLKLKANDFKAAQHILEVAVKLGDRFQKQTHGEQELGLRAYMAQRKVVKGEQTTDKSKATVVVVEADRGADAGDPALTSPGVGESQRQIASPADAEFDVERDSLSAVQLLEAPRGQVSKPPAELRYLGEEVEDDDDEA